MKTALFVALIFVTLEISGCASRPWMETPGRYSSFHDFVATITRNQVRKDIPDDVKRKIGECFADVAVANVTPAQLRELDAAAQGKTSISSKMQSKVLRQVEDAFGEVKRGDFSILEPYCPDDIDSFRPYVRYD